MPVAELDGKSSALTRPKSLEGSPDAVNALTAFMPPAFRTNAPPGPTLASQPLPTLVTGAGDSELLPLTSPAAFQVEPPSVVL